MNGLGKQGRLHYHGGLSLSEIDRRTVLTRKTIRKWLKAPDGAEPGSRRRSSETKIKPYAEGLVKMLETGARRPARERRTALKLFAEIQGQGFAGNYSRLTEFIRCWRLDGSVTASKAFVPLRFAPGEAHQFDWCEGHQVIGRLAQDSRRALEAVPQPRLRAQAYPRQSHEMRFDAHARAFAALGDIARRGIDDNMKTAVDKVKKGKARVVNTRFAAMASHHLFVPDFCNVGRRTCTCEVTRHGRRTRDAVPALNENANVLERPKLGAKAMLCGFVHEHWAKGLQLLLVHAPLAALAMAWLAARRAALIEYGFPRARRLPCHAYRIRGLRSRLARQQHSPCAQSPSNRLGQSLRHHESDPILAKYRYNA